MWPRMQQQWGLQFGWLVAKWCVWGLHEQTGWWRVHPGCTDWHITRRLGLSKPEAWFFWIMHRWWRIHRRCRWGVQRRPGWSFTRKQHVLRCLCPSRNGWFQLRLDEFHKRGDTGFVVLWFPVERRGWLCRGVAAAIPTAAATKFTIASATAERTAASTSSSPLPTGGAIGASAAIDGVPNHNPCAQRDMQPLQEPVGVDGDAKCPGPGDANQRHSLSRRQDHMGAKLHLRGRLWLNHRRCDASEPNHAQPRAIHQRRLDIHGRRPHPVGERTPVHGHVSRQQLLFNLCGCTCRPFPAIPLDSHSEQRHLREHLTVRGIHPSWLLGPHRSPGFQQRASSDQRIGRWVRVDQFLREPGGAEVQPHRRRSNHRGRRKL